jgi:signal transduction histidine kinase
MMSYSWPFAVVSVMVLMLYISRRMTRLAPETAALSAGHSDESEEHAEGESTDREKYFEQRARDYARFLASIADASARRLEDVRLPLHILLENRFGELNENQEEMLGAARAAAEAVDADLLSLREIAALDLGERTLRQDRMKLSELIDALRPLLMAAASQRAVALEFDITPLLPAITGDRALLQDALVTVLRESVLSASLNARVRVSVEREGPSIAFLVSGGGSPVSTVRLAVAIRVVQAHAGSVIRSTTDLRIQLPATGVR